MQFTLTSEYHKLGLSQSKSQNFGISAEKPRPDFEHKNVLRLSVAENAHDVEVGTGNGADNWKLNSWKCESHNHSNRRHFGN